MDDDIKCYKYAFCYCDSCLNQFESGYNLFRKYGRTVCREQYKQLMEKEDFLSAWMEYNRDVAASVYALIEQTVHGIDNDIQLGMMWAPDGCITKSEAEAWINALSGDGRKIRVRPGGGFYTDEQMGGNGLYVKLNNICDQIRYINEKVGALEAELEMFPKQSTSKSNRVIEFELINYMAFAGCSGVAYNLLSDGSSEWDNRWNLIKELEPFLEKVNRVIGGDSPLGYSYYLGKEGQDDWVRKTRCLRESSNAFQLAGIPMVNDNDRSAGYILTEHIAPYLSEESIRDCFSKSVFLTAKAAQILNERGYGKYTCANVIKEYPDDTFEICRGNEKEMTLKRDCAQAFKWMDSYDKAYSFEFTRKGKTDYIGELYNFSYAHLGHSFGYHQKRDGKYIAVSGYFPLSCANSLARKSQVRSIFSLFDRDMPYVISNAKIAMKYYPKAGVLFFANYAFDDARDVSFYCPGTSVSEFYCFSGRERTVKVKNTGDNTWVIKKVPYLSVGYVKING